MFIMTLPNTTKIGDTVDVKINGQPERLTHRDATSLVVHNLYGDDAVHCIVKTNTDGALVRFICADADGKADFAIF